MDTRTVIPPVSLTIAEPLLWRLYEHLFPGDGDEHGAVIAAGIAQGPKGTRLLAKDLILAQDGVDYVPGTRGYRALTAQFVVDKSHYCAQENLCYLAIHCHGGNDRVSFSADDIASHVRGYPALLDITRGGPVGALVFARNAVAGDIWTPQGRFELAYMNVVGPRMHRLYPQPVNRLGSVDLVFDRQARLFGDWGQKILSELKVGIIGLGGGGSLLNEWLARLGVGHIVAVDFKRLDPTNLPRVVGATHLDALSFLSRWDRPWAKRLRERFARHKVHIAQRVARQANPRIRYDAVVGNIVDEPVARQLTDADFLFLAADSMQSRLVFNALVHQYLIPGIQIGVKVSVNKASGQVESIHTASRPILPTVGGGCLWCYELILPARLNEEALSEDERRAWRYIDDDRVAAPSVITLNALSAAEAANDFMMMCTGLYCEDVELTQQLGYVRQRQLSSIDSVYKADCLDCGNTGRSRRARGDRVRLPCRALA